jgi:hypothetical protein
MPRLLAGAAPAVTGRDSIVAARLLQRAGGAWAHSGGDCGVAAGETGAAAGLSEGLAWAPAPHMLGANPSPRQSGGTALSLKQSPPANHPLPEKRYLYSVPLSRIQTKKQRP